MALSLLTNPCLVNRDRLFYDRFEYSICLRLDEADSLRMLDHSKIDSTLDSKKIFRSRNMNFGGSWRARNKEITETTRQNCHAMCDELNSVTDRKVTFCQDWIYIYSNDLDWISHLSKIDYVTMVKFQRAVIDRPRDTLIIKSSKYRTRSYLRPHRLSENQRENLSHFLSVQTDIRMSPGLDEWVNSEKKYRYIYEHYFIDHDSDAVLTMLGLIIERPIRKTVALIKHK